MKYTEQYWKDVKTAIEAFDDKKALCDKTVLITGASGMICSTIVDILLYLNKNYEAGIKIYAAGRNKERMDARFAGYGEEDGYNFLYYDAVSNESCKVDDDIDMIIHGASNANPAIYMEEPVETVLANVIGLNNMLKLAVDKSVDRLLYVSSSEVYGKKESPEPYGESDYGFVDILNERAGYPSSKRTGESLCVAYSMEHDLDVVTVRPGHIYGPTITGSDSRASADFTRKAIAGENIIMKSKGEQIRSYCHTLDCATAILTVLIKGERANAYNISNPHSICSIRDIAEALANYAGVQLIIDLPTEREKKSFNLMNNSSLKSDKLEALGWNPVFSLKAGVKNTIDTLR